jgi:signal transduction histidine kinase
MQRSPQRERELAPTGLPSIALAPWGSHCCLFYCSRNDLLDAAIAFFAAGLDNGERCIWITSDAAGAGTALRSAISGLSSYEQRGQMQVLEHGDWYTSGAAFDGAGVIEAWLDLERRALAAGYTGLRVSGDMYWLNHDTWPSFAEYEAALHSAFDGRRIIALCSYCLERCFVEDVLGVARTHDFVLLRQRGKWGSLHDPNMLTDAQRLLALEGVTAALAKPATRDEVVRAMAGICRSIGAGRIVIAAAGSTVDVGPAGANTAGHSLSRAVLPGREPDAGQSDQWLTDRNEIERRYSDVAAGAAALAAVSLTIRQKHLGTMFIAFDAPTAFDDEHRAFLKDIALRTALALERAELLEEAERKRRSKVQLTAMLSHELRNPLASIQAVAEVLKVVDEPDQRKDWQAALDRQVTHMAHLLDDMLDISRMTHGKIAIARERVDVLRVLRDALEDKRPEIGRRGLALHVDLDVGASELFSEGDRIRLTQVFHNLLSNALKFTDAPGDVVVTCRRVDGRLAVTFRDSGSGIEAQLLPHVFEPFTQGTQATSRSTGGLGLGLALVKELVELHGGTVSAASPGPNQGSTFTVVLPVVE